MFAALAILHQLPVMIGREYAPSRGGMIFLDEIGSNQESGMKWYRFTGNGVWCLID